MIVYDPDIRAMARHQRLSGSAAANYRTPHQHRPGPDLRRKQELLRGRFEELSTDAVSFFDQLLRTRRFGKDEAVRILGLLSTYRQQDLVAALQRAHRYRAFSFAAVERILGAFAEPRSALESIDNQAREHLDELLRENPVPPRPTGDYQQLLEYSADPPSTEENP